MRNSRLEVLIGGCEWTPVNVLLEETALTLTLLVEDWEVNPQACGTEKRFCNYIIENPNGAMNHRFVKIEKQGGQGLGISIQGGAENNKPIVISKIFPDMPASQTRQLFVGDMILAVNSLSLINATHNDAVRALKQSGDVVNLQVQYGGELRNNVARILSWDEDEQQTTDNRIRCGLKLAFVLRSSLNHEDIENRIIEIRSHSGRHILILRCASSEEADSWFEVIHSCAETLLIQALAQVNLILGQDPQIYKMGWMAKQENELNQETGFNLMQWKPVFTALTKHHLLFYDSVPALKHEWAYPHSRVPLIATRVVQTTARSFPVISGLSDVISFTTRTGTQEGVTTYFFRVGTHRDLASWVKNIIEITYEVCSDTDKVSTPCVWQDRHCELVIGLNSGISLESPTKEVIWSFPFEEIRASGDYENRYLWLDFGPIGGEHEMGMIDSPKAVVFILHSFLATKCHELGLYT